MNVRILSLILLLGLAGCSTWFPDEEDLTRGWSAQKLYNEASAELHDGNYDDAIKYYEILQARYPFGRYAKQAQIDLTYAYYKSGEPEAALAAADRFIKLYPRNPHVDYAYYLKGLVNFNKGITFMNRFIPTDASQRDPGAALDSFKDFGELIRRFPKSRYAEDARLRMLYLRNNLAKHEAGVADYYYRRGAYVAAAQRAGFVIENYPRSTAVRSALEIMIRAYQQLDEPDLARDASRVLALNRNLGTLVTDRPDADQITWGRRIWNFLELDKN